MLLFISQYLQIQLMCVHNEHTTDEDFRKA